MKIRIEGQTIRFRLSHSDVHTLEHTGQIDAELYVPSLLQFTIQKGRLNVYYNQNQMVVSLPEDWLTSWTENEKVGFEFDHDFKRGPADMAFHSLNVIVEKDYPCAHTKEGKALFGKPQKMN